MTVKEVIEGANRESRLTVKKVMDFVRGLSPSEYPDFVSIDERKLEGGRSEQQAFDMGDVPEELLSRKVDSFKYDKNRRLYITMEQSEDMQKICDLLCKALQATRVYGDLKELRYKAASAAVEAVFPAGQMSISVHYDTGAMMIRDILRELHG